jgi:hypothetical protein
MAPLPHSSTEGTVVYRKLMVRLMRRLSRERNAGAPPRRGKASNARVGIRRQRGARGTDGLGKRSVRERAWRRLRSVRQPLPGPYREARPRSSPSSPPADVTRQGNGEAPPLVVPRAMRRCRRWLCLSRSLLALATIALFEPAVSGLQTCEVATRLAYKPRPGRPSRSTGGSSPSPIAVSASTPEYPRVIFDDVRQREEPQGHRAETKGVNRRRLHRTPDRAT